MTAAEPAYHERASCGGLWRPRRRICATALLLVLTGCYTGSRRAADQGMVPRDNAALTEYIANQPYVTAEPGYRATYVLWKGEPFEGEYAELAAQLRAARIIGDWDLPPDALLDRGAVGFILARALQVKSGLNWQLTGLGRYAWRELYYLGIVETISEYGYVPGGQFVGMLGRSEDYRRRAARPVPAVDLGPPPGR